MEDVEVVLDDFIQVALLAGVSLRRAEIEFDILSAPHAPKSLPSGKMGVYVFLWNNQCLKVGKVGAKSGARYVSQHYSPNSSGSNLARSILNKKVEMGLIDINDRNIGDWIKTNTTRINFLMSQSVGMPVLGLLEAFLQCRFKPKFEGFESQQ